MKLICVYAKQCSSTYCPHKKPHEKIEYIVSRHRKYLTCDKSDICYYRETNHGLSDKIKCIPVIDDKFKGELERILYI